MVAFLLPFAKPNTRELTISKGNSAEEILVNGLKNGDTQAIEELYKMYSGALMGIISRIVKFDEVAEDVFQDTFVKIWKSIGQYDSAKGRLFTWMANLAKNTAIDQIRSKNYTNNIKTDDLSKIPIETLDQSNHIQFNPEVIGMRQLINHLKADQKNILNLIYFEGYTHVEVSEKLNMPLGTVKTKIRLSILALRQYFNETSITKSISA